MVTVGGVVSASSVRLSETLPVSGAPADWCPSTAIRYVVPAWPSNVTLLGRAGGAAPVVARRYSADGHVSTAVTVDVARDRDGPPGLVARRRAVDPQTARRLHAVDLGEVEVG